MWLKTFPCVATTEQFSSEGQAIWVDEEEQGGVRSRRGPCRLFPKQCWFCGVHAAGLTIRAPFFGARAIAAQLDFGANAPGRPDCRIILDGEALWI